MAVLELFLSSILKFVRAQDATSLQDYLRVEPPLPDNYAQMAKELQRFQNTTQIETFVTTSLPEKPANSGGDGDVWPGFIAFMVDYLDFWRNVNFEDLLNTHAQLNQLVNSSITALSHGQYGIIMLPTAVQLSAALAKLAMTLDKRPDLTRNLRKLSSVDMGGDGEGRKTLVETSAETIQRAFTMCLNDRTPSRSGVDRDGHVEGKKIGIYKFANLVLKLLFQCKKTRLATQLFTNLSIQSPPLRLYPASQRVTYLYYLGRFHFSNTHYFRSQLCLQAAYDQCHALAIKQRRLILIYLFASNILCGRFPSKAFLAREESRELVARFAPLTRAIRRGDLAGFKAALGPEGGSERWFFERGILLPLLYRAEVLVWRSLARRVFLLTYVIPTDPSSRKAPTLDLNHLVMAARMCARKLDVAVAASSDVSGWGDASLPEIEAIAAALVQQGLLHGFVSHGLGRFAILGAKQKGSAIRAGFPGVWEVVRSRAAAEGEGKEADVPGWKTAEVGGGAGGGFGGVVNLSGIARPVGSGS